ncbi:hypothetical protein HCB18_28080, partial [Salinispora arenicola]|nr:hypothetical protein [Salinispora arenicola]NIL61208.1 hypothetical protein [Salinispora arenicola]
MNTILRRSVLSIAGLALSTGVVAGPLAADTTTPTTSMPADSAVAVSVAQAAKPDMDILIPHGTQGEQSRISLGDEQTANVKAI